MSDREEHQAQGAGGGGEAGPHHEVHGTRERHRQHQQGGGADPCQEKTSPNCDGARGYQRGPRVPCEGPTLPPPVGLAAGDQR